MDYPEPPCRIRTAGRVRAGPWFSSPGTREEDCLLVVIEAGYGRHRRRAGVRTLEPGLVGLILPEEPGLLLADAEEPFTYAYCRFAGDWALAQATALNTASGGTWRATAVASRIAALVGGMGHLQRRELPALMGRAEQLLIEALGLLGPRPAAVEPRLDGAGLDAYLRDHIDVPTDLPRIAADFGCSVSWLGRRCRELTGRSVVHRHRELKLAWACELLRATRDPIAAIARRVGYADALYFSRVFRRCIGRSPRSWRRWAGEARADRPG